MDMQHANASRTNASQANGNGRSVRARGFAVWLALIACLGFASTTASAQEGEDVDLADSVAIEPLDPGKVDAFYGAYTENVSIEVPAFRGLEPKLGLSYNSSGRNGYLGMGWSLSGFSVIERASPGRGAPRYGATVGDIWLLDGQELIPCATGSLSPSCVLGSVVSRGTHSTRIENYQRIRFEPTSPSGARWVITDQNGTQYIYSARHTVGGEVFQYWLERIVDTRGNTVTFAYTVDAANNWMYPYSIGYNRTSIRFYHQDPATTPDHRMQRATGKGIATMVRRLGSIVIDVQAPSGVWQRLRAYQLAYSTSLHSKRSQLVSVRQYGRDAAFDAGGQITGGTALPARTFSWAGEVLGPTTAVNTNPQTAGSYGKSVLTRVFADLNGDNRSDLLLIGGSTLNDGANLRWAHASGGGNYGALQIAKVAATGTFRGANYKPHSADVNGDGLTDVVFMWGSSAAAGAKVHVVLARPTTTIGGATYVADSLVSHTLTTTGRYSGNGWRNKFMADVNGDGRDDAVFVYTSAASNTGVKTLVSLASSQAGNPNVVSFGPLTLSTPQATGNFVTNWKRSMADVNGDGRMDMVWLFHGTGAKVAVSLSNGDGSFAPLQTSTAEGTSNYNNDGWNGHAVMSDVNGDGKLDAVWTYGAATVNSNGTRVHVRLSNGDGSFGPLIISTPQTTGAYGNENWSSKGVADVNGDNLPDALWFYSYYFECYAPPGYVCNVQNQNLGRRMEVSLNLGDGRFGPGQRVVVSTTGYYGTPWSIHMADVDGNGVQEPVWLLLGQVASEIGTFQHSHWVNLGVRVKATLTATTRLLMTRSSNGMGATTDITYTPSSTWTNQTMPLVTDTVSSIRTDAGFGAAADRYAETKYSYIGGLYDALSRRFLGFRTVERTLPCVQGETACPKDVTVYSQNYGSVSKPVLVNRLGGDGRLLAATQQMYNTGTHGPIAHEGPYISQLIRTIEYSYNSAATLPSYPADGVWLPCPTASCRRTSVDHAYDQWWTVTTDPAQEAERSRWRFGRASTVVHYGDIGSTDGVANPTGDDHLEYFFAGINPEKFIVAPAAHNVYRYPWSTSADLLQSSLTYYDGMGSWASAPTTGNPTQTLNLHKESNTWVSRYASYDGYGNQRTSTDERGYVTSTDYDTAFNLYPVRTTRALGQAEQEVTETGWLFPCATQERSVGPNGADDTTIVQYDPLCRKTRVGQPLGAYKTWAYLDFGTPSLQRIVETEPSDRGTGVISTERRFDGFSRTNRNRVNGYVCDHTLYNARGQVRKQNSPSFDCTDAWTVGTETFFDALDRPIRVVKPNNTVVTTSYTYHRWKYIVDEENKWRAQLQDAYGRVTAEAHQLDGVWRQSNYSYDALGHLTQVTDPASNLWSYTYDSLGRKIVERDPDRGTLTYEYFADGALRARVDARGQRTEWSYDGLGRKRSETLRAGTAQAQAYTWTYDQARTEGATVYRNRGRLTAQTEPTGGTTYDYDLAGNLVRRIKTIDGIAYTFRHGYYPGRRLKSTTYPDNTTLGTSSGPLEYDVFGRLEWLPELRVGAAYNAAGLVVGISAYQGDYYGGCGSPNLPRVRQAFAYDSQNRLTRLKVDKQLGYWSIPEIEGDPCWLTHFADEQALQDYTYTYTATDRIQTITNAMDVNDNRSFAYDDIGRLRSATTSAAYGGTQSFTYDDAHNMTYNSRIGTYSYPAAGAGSVRPHAVLVAGTGSYGYDAAGNMTSRTGNPMTWDGANRLVAHGAAAYAYDGEGQRVKKISGGLITHYPAPDYEVTAGVVTRYASIAGKKVAKRVGGTIFWLNTDHLGSVDMVTDSNRNAVQRMRNHAYGERASAQSAHVEQTGFLGELRDAESGLIYQRVRYYDPVLARYTSPDWLETTKRGVGTNRYAYSLNDPVNLIDNGNSAAFLMNHVINGLPQMFPNGFTMTASAGFQPGMISALGTPAQLQHLTPSGSLGVGVQVLDSHGQHNADIGVYGQYGAGASLPFGSMLGLFSGTVDKSGWTWSNHVAGGLNTMMSMNLTAMLVGYAHVEVGFQNSSLWAMDGSESFHTGVDNLMGRWNAGLDFDESGGFQGASLGMSLLGRKPMSWGMAGDYSRTNVFWSYQGKPSSVNYDAFAPQINQYLGSGFSNIHDPFFYDPFGSNFYNDPFGQNTSSPWGW
ncbi:MAG: hypothetical protein HOP03_13880 [Lysobacter sp.]|nr:hypothetical protein [Lysobacter sp.]